MFVLENEEDDWLHTHQSEPQQEVVEPTEEPMDVLDKEAQRKADAEDIHNAVIKAQEQLAIIDNKIDAYQRQYGMDNETMGRIYNWTSSVEGTAAKAKKTAKAALISDNIAKTFMTDGFVFDITKVAGGIALDVQKLKEVDKWTYDHLAKMYPRKVKESTKVSVKEQKGAAGVAVINYGENN